MHTTDLNALSAATLRGDNGAFGLIVQRLQGPLFGYLGRMGLSQTLAEDIAQEAFVKAWQNLARFDSNRAQFSTWLFAIARNLALNELTSARRNHEQSADDDTPEQENCEKSQAENLMAKQQRAALLAALRNLPDEDRSVLALCYVNELDLASIARIEHCTLAAVKTRIHRAKLKLRELLKEDA